MAASGNSKRKRNSGSQTSGVTRGEQSRRALENSQRAKVMKGQRNIAMALRWPLVAVGIGLILLGGSFWLDDVNGGTLNWLAQIVRFIGSMAVGIGAVYAVVTLSKLRKR